MHVKKGNYRIIDENPAKSGDATDTPVAGATNWGSDIKKSEGSSKYDIKKKIKEIVARSISGRADSKLGKKIEGENEKKIIHK